MRAGNEGEVLLRVADQLSLELGYSENDVIAHADSPLRRGDGMAAMLDPEDERLVARLREGLARVAAALESGAEATIPENAVPAALDGAELVLRGELVRGNTGELAGLLPSFVFMVALPIVEQDRALELSRRTEELLKRASEGGPYGL